MGAHIILGDGSVKIHQNQFVLSFWLHIRVNRLGESA